MRHPPSAPSFLALALLLLLLPACGLRKSAHATPEQSTESANSASTSASPARPAHEAVPVEELPSRVLAPPPGAAGFAWDGQQSVHTSALPLERTLKASLSAFKKLSFALDTSASRRGTDSALLVASNPEKIRAQVRYKTQAGGRTEIRAKVGVVGDRSGSERLLEEIRLALEAK